MPSYHVFVAAIDRIIRRFLLIAGCLVILLASGFLLVRFL